MTCNTALKTLVTLFVLCTESAAQTTGDADRMFYFANDKVKDAVVHDVCDVRWPEMRDQLDAADRVIYGLIVAALQDSTITAKGTRQPKCFAYGGAGSRSLRSSEILAQGHTPASRVQPAPPKRPWVLSPGNLSTMDDWRPLLPGQAGPTARLAPGGNYQAPSSSSSLSILRSTIRRHPHHRRPASCEVKTTTFAPWSSGWAARWLAAS